MKKHLSPKNRFLSKKAKETKRHNNHIEAFEQRMLLAGAGSDRSLEDFTQELNINILKIDPIDTTQSGSLSPDAILKGVFKDLDQRDSKKDLLNAYIYCSSGGALGGFSDLELSVKSIDDINFIDKIATKQTSSPFPTNNYLELDTVHFNAFKHSVEAVKSNLNEFLTKMGQSITLDKPIDAAKFDHFFADKFKDELKGKPTLTEIPQSILQELNASDANLHAMIEGVNSMEAFFKAVEAADKTNATSHMRLLYAALNPNANINHEGTIYSSTGQKSDLYFKLLNNLMQGTASSLAPEEVFEGKFFTKLLTDATGSAELPDALKNMIVQADENLSEFAWKGEVAKIKELSQKKDEASLNQFSANVKGLVATMDSVQEKLIQDALKSGKFEHLKKEMGFMKSSFTAIQAEFNGIKAPIQNGNNGITVDGITVNEAIFADLQAVLNSKVDALTASITQVDQVESAWKDYSSKDAKGPSGFSFSWDTLYQDGAAEKLVSFIFDPLYKDGVNMKDWFSSTWAGMQLTGVKGTLKWGLDAGSAKVGDSVNKGIALVSAVPSIFEKAGYNFRAGLDLNGVSISDQLDFSWTGKLLSQDPNGSTDPNIKMIVDQLGLIKATFLKPEKLLENDINVNDASTIKFQFEQFFTHLKGNIANWEKSGLLSKQGTSTETHWFSSLKNLKMNLSGEAQQSLDDYIRLDKGAADDAKINAYFKDFPTAIESAVQSFVDEIIVKDQINPLPLVKVQEILKDLKDVTSQFVADKTISSEFTKSLQAEFQNVQTALKTYADNVETAVKSLSPSKLATAFNPNKLSELVDAIKKGTSLKSNMVKDFGDWNKAVEGISIMKDASNYQFPVIKKLNEAISLDMVGEKEIAWKTILNLAQLGEREEYRSVIKGYLEKIQQNLPDDLKIGSDTVNPKQLLEAQIERLEFKEQYSKDKVDLAEQIEKWNNTEKTAIEGAFEAFNNKYELYANAKTLADLKAINNITNEKNALSALKTNLETWNKKLDQLSKSADDESKFNAKDRKAVADLQNNLNAKIAEFETLSKTKDLNSLYDFFDADAVKEKRAQEIEMSEAKILQINVAGYETLINSSLGKTGGEEAAKLLASFGPVLLPFKGLPANPDVTKWTEQLGNAFNHLKNLSESLDKSGLATAYADRCTTDGITEDSEHLKSLQAIDQEINSIVAKDIEVITNAPKNIIKDIMSTQTSMDFGKINSDFKALSDTMVNATNGVSLKADLANAWKAAQEELQQVADDFEIAGKLLSDLSTNHTAGSPSVLEVALRNILNGDAVATKYATALEELKSLTRALELSSSLYQLPEGQLSLSPVLEKMKDYIKEDTSAEGSPKKTVLKALQVLMASAEGKTTESETAYQALAGALGVPADQALNDILNLEILRHDVKGQLPQTIIDVNQVVTTEMAKVESNYNTAKAHYQAVTDLNIIDTEVTELTELKAVKTNLETKLSELKTLRDGAATVLRADEIAPLDKAIGEILVEGYSKTAAEAAAGVGAAVLGAVVGAVLPVGTIAGGVIGGAVGTQLLAPYLQASSGALADINAKIQVVEFAQATTKARIDSNVGGSGTIIPTNAATQILPPLNATSSGSPTPTQPPASSPNAQVDVADLIKGMKYNNKGFKNANKSTK